MPSVIDASVAIRASFPTQYVAQAEQLMAPGLGSLFAPIILRQEFVNAGFRLERRGFLAAERLDAEVRALNTSGVTFLWDDHWLVRALEVARRYRQTRIFDAIYLACAEDLGVDLWTCDRRFIRSFPADRPNRLKLCPDDLA